VIPGGKFWVRMGLSKRGCCASGHRKSRVLVITHLLVDADLPPLDQGNSERQEPLALWSWSKPRRTSSLPPGRHTLQMLFADEKPRSTRPAALLQEDHHNRTAVKPAAAKESLMPKVHRLTVLASVAAAAVIAAPVLRPDAVRQGRLPPQETCHEAF